MITKEALHKKTPQEITALLYEACLDRLEEAKYAIENKDYIVANSKLQKSSDILNRLGGGLNYEAGIVADQLETVYNYLADKVVQANYKKDITIIDEVTRHLTGISLAWHNAMEKNEDIMPKSIRNKASAYEQNMIFKD